MNLWTLALSTLAPLKMKFREALWLRVQLGHIKITDLRITEESGSQIIQQLINRMIQKSSETALTFNNIWLFKF